MKTFFFTREQLCLLLYALVASKTMVDASEHNKIDDLIKILNQ